MQTVGWIKRDYDTGRITNRSKIHYTDDRGKTTLCGIVTDQAEYTEIDDGSDSHGFCKKCERKMNKEVYNGE